MSKLFRLKLIPFVHDTIVGGLSVVVRFLHRWERRGCSSPWKGEGQEVWRVDTIPAGGATSSWCKFLSSSSIPRATCCGYTTSMWLEEAGQDKRNSRDPVPALIPASISKRLAFRREGRGGRSSSFSIVKLSRGISLCY